LNLCRAVVLVATSRPLLPRSRRRTRPRSGGRRSLTSRRRRHRSHRRLHRVSTRRGIGDRAPRLGRRRLTLRRDDGTRRARRKLRRRWRLSIKRGRDHSGEGGDDRDRTRHFHLKTFYFLFNNFPGEGPWREKKRSTLVRHVPGCRSTCAGACSLRVSTASYAPENKMKGRYQNSKSMVSSCPARPLWRRNADGRVPVLASYSRKLVTA
jgi:hypothetical protein